jgi:uncharacterized protein
LLLRRTIVLTAFICTSSNMVGQRIEDLDLIFSENILNVDSRDVDTIHSEQLKSGSFFFETMKWPILFWQKLISSQMKPRCYFHPSCSQFTYEAIRQYGLLGIFLGLDRISRCNAFSEEKYPYDQKTKKLYDPVDHYGVTSRQSREKSSSDD